MPINAATIGSDHQISKSTFSDRVELLLNARGCSKAWLANELGVSKQALNHILRHAKKPKFVCEIAILFDINPLWLQTGEQSNQQKLNMPLRTISLYAFDDILREKQIQNITQLEKIFLKPENEHKHFALLLHDYPAMKPKFENNSILLFDEDVTPKNGAYVLAKADNDHVFFRQFYIENKTITLKPIDPAFEMIKCDNCEIMGTLIETRMKF